MTHKIAILGMMVLFTLGALLKVWTPHALAASALSPQLPIFANFDDNAPGGTVTGGWRLSELYRFGSSGMGWGVDGESALSTNTLQLNAQIDLRTAVAPRLRFASNASSPGAEPFASVEIVVNGIPQKSNPIQDISGFWTETVIDLTPYRGSVIELRWSFTPHASDTMWMIDNVVVEDAAQSPTAMRAITTMP